MPSDETKETAVMGSMASSGLGILFATEVWTSMSKATLLISGMGHWRRRAHSIMCSLNSGSCSARVCSSSALISSGSSYSSATRFPPSTL
jgi:hypothetical protein